MPIDANMGYWISVFVNRPCSDFVFVCAVSKNRNIFFSCLQLRMPPPRYQAVYVDMEQTSHKHAQTNWRLFPRHYIERSPCTEILRRANFLGGQKSSKPRLVMAYWWNPNAWEHWNKPYEHEIYVKALMRMGIDSAWMKMFDNYCFNDDYEMTRFKCCICDTLS